MPSDDQLTGDLTAPKWEQTGSGKIKVEEKDEIRKRLGRSPDRGDTVTMAFAAKQPRTDHTEAVPVALGKRSTWTGMR